MNTKNSVFLAHAMPLHMSTYAILKLPNNCHVMFSCYIAGCYGVPVEDIVLQVNVYPTCIYGLMM